MLIMVSVLMVLCLLCCGAPFYVTRLAIHAFGHPATAIGVGVVIAVTLVGYVVLRWWLMRHCSDNLASQPGFTDNEQDAPDVSLRSSQD